MATASHNSPDILREEILADARQQAAQIIDAARHEAEALLAKAGDEARKKREEVLTSAQSEAARRTERALATVPVEAARRRSARIEVLLQSIHDEARRELHPGDQAEYREAILALAADAVSRMSGTTFVLRLSPADRAAFGAELAGEVARRTGKSTTALSISDDPAIVDGGVIVQDADGRQVWDNRLPARLERLWPGMRRQIAVQVGFIGGSTS